jgi:hypothetical protein
MVDTTGCRGERGERGEPYGWLVTARSPVPERRLDSGVLCNLPRLGSSLEHSDICLVGTESQKSYMVGPFGILDLFGANLPPSYCMMTYDVGDNEKKKKDGFTICHFPSQKGPEGLYQPGLPP